MRGFVTSLAKAAAAVVTVPVALVADAATLGGVTVGRSRPYTAEAVGDFVRNLKNATRPSP